MPTNILTVDVDDWLQSVPDLRPGAAARRRPVPPSEAVLRRTHALLDLLAAQRTEATCFVLGSVAERYPELVTRIHAEGHEVATHGYGHAPVYRLSRRELAEDIRRSKELLEELTGERVLGYRAPYFSLTSAPPSAFEVLVEHGLVYDSSTLPVHRLLYGRIPGWKGGADLPRFPHLMELGNGARLVELPASTVRWAGLNLPLPGGATLRLARYLWLASGVRRLNDHGQPAVFYIHPHDLDAEPLASVAALRAHRAPLRLRLAHPLLSAGRGRNPDKLARMLRELPFTSIRRWLRDSKLGHPDSDRRAPGG